ncbi:hypothetical protein NQZ68_012137 [Dissostichus eleginoides]|nr:hypothetical protein NQZ68_012137 [Dissostichus eleginoides]
MNCNGPTISYPNRDLTVCRGSMLTPGVAFLLIVRPPAYVPPTVADGCQQGPRSLFVVTAVHNNSLVSNRAESYTPQIEHPGTKLHSSVSEVPHDETQGEIAVGGEGSEQSHFIL